MAAFKVVQKTSGDQVAGYDEEDIDAGKAAWNCRDSEMEEYNRQHRNSPKAIDIAPVLHSRSPVFAGHGETAQSVHSRAMSLADQYQRITLCPPILLRCNISVKVGEQTIRKPPCGATGFSDHLDASAASAYF
ncbi:hypothetical protein LRP31_32195 [Mesorhizobium mediterraneum]|uniref:hypothetical protein n=1 Tax=Mesorhizobium TaxID=68287 RepID=UPI001FD992A8|nr:MULTISPECIES: hypothetical protein [Mesorhizobium]WIW56979.1 hypothetical protein LRP31_32195 [Mesorhizobium mediterraneum]